MLDPTLKLEYLDAAWDQKYIKIGMSRMKQRVSNYRSMLYNVDILNLFFSSLFIRLGTRLRRERQSLQGIVIRKSQVRV